MDVRDNNGLPWSLCPRLRTLYLFIPMDSLHMRHASDSRQDYITRNTTLGLSARDSLNSRLESTRLWYPPPWSTGQDRHLSSRLDFPHQLKTETQEQFALLMIAYVATEMT